VCTRAARNNISRTCCLKSAAAATAADLFDGNAVVPVQQQTASTPATTDDRVLGSRMSAVATWGQQEQRSRNSEPGSSSVEVLASRSVTAVCCRAVHPNKPPNVQCMPNAEASSKALRACRFRLRALNPTAAYL
jgi:hypothetical protein